jgi:hypothetical protein
MREVTVGCGEDTSCARCGCPLPAGAPALVAGDAEICIDCAEDEEAAST